MSYVLETGMREMLRLTEGQPDLEIFVRSAIRNHVDRTYRDHNAA